jgi:hypothetical protein
MMKVTGRTSDRLFKFGPSGTFLGSITECSDPGSQTGVILFGLGISEVRIARRLAKLGLVVMQVRLVKNYHDFDQKYEYYDDSGVWACRQAIDELTSKRRIQRVVLMGICGESNLCFNTALVDPRVVGLILLNPHVNDRVTVVDIYRRNLFSLSAWRRLLTGKSRLRALNAFFRSQVRSADQQSLAAQSRFKKDIILPPDFDQKLTSLVNNRGVRALIIFSHAEAGLRYFWRIYGETVDKLVASGGLTFEVISRDAHNFYADDESAFQLCEIVPKWAEKVLVQRDLQQAFAAATTA